MFSSNDYTGAPEDGWLDAEGSEIIYTGHVEDETGDMLRVHVDPLIFFVHDPSQGKLVRALVRVSRFGSSDVDDHIFTADDNDAWTWKEFLADPEDKRYEWWAEYYTAQPFSRIKLGSKDDPIPGEGETIMLTPPETTEA